MGRYASLPTKGNMGAKAQKNRDKMRKSSLFLVMQCERDAANCGSGGRWFESTQLYQRRRGHSLIIFDERMPIGMRRFWSAHGDGAAT